MIKNYEKYEDFLKKLMIPSQLLFKISKKIIKKLFVIVDVYHHISKVLTSKGIYRVMRIITFPMHKIWIKIWILSVTPRDKPNIFDQGGVMVITGIPGAGKSSLAFEIMNRSLALKGKPWYVNSKMERVKFDKKNQVKYRNHAIYDFEEFWSQGKMHKTPNKYIFGGMTIEEYHRILNYRDSMTKDYKDLFMPFSDYAVTVRKEIGSILILTQMNRVDAQLMNLSAHVSEVRIDIGFNYPDWLLTSGIFRFMPLGWHIETYRVTSNLSSGFEKQLIKSWYLKSKYTDWDQFDTYAEKDDYNHVPMDYPPNTKKVRFDSNA